MTQEPRDPDAPPAGAGTPPPAAPPDRGAEPAPHAPPQPTQQPPPQGWQSQPQQPAPPPPSGGQPSAAMLPGPLEGTQIADFVTRLVAFIIDAVILGIVNYLVWVIFGGLFFALGGLSIVIHGVVVAAISAGYFIYFWTTRRQTPGMTFMKLLVVEDGTGATLSQDQAIRRWLYLGLPYAISTLLSVGGLGFGFIGFGGLAILFTLASIAALVALGWQIYLAYTTYQDPRNKGAHDKFVNSVVVSYGPSPFGQQAPR